MNPFDAVLRVSSRPMVKRASVTLVAGVTAGVLFFTPAVSVVAAGGGSHSANSISAFQQDDDESKIVPRESDEDNADQGDESGDDGGDVVVIQYNTDEDDQDDDEQVEDEDESDSSDKPSADDDEDDSARPLKLSGIMPSKADIAPGQWAGVFDSRLIEPFMVAPQPQLLQSEAIGLNAPVTPREIVSGEMQTPKDEFEVSWYKETASPGEKGNMVFAGHLNWYGVPQAVFYNINALEKGDEIVVTGENGIDYTYKVKWVKLIETADADLDELVGETKKASLTLITCGGEWDPAAAQYKQRTVVRAELVVKK